ncbi:MAG: chemotaxis protein CheA [Syntrophorhabdales bacterium]|jgi:two-component system chemotaxis sensor kinase CheA
MNDDHRQLFEEEAHELLADLENYLLELEQAPDDKELIGSIFRAMHTIKGSGAMFGFEDIAAFTHEVESVYDKVRDGQIPVTTELINLTLKARDQITVMLKGQAEGGSAPGMAAPEIIAGLKALTPGAPATTILPAPTPGDEEKAVIEGGTDAVTYRIRFAPCPDIFLTGTNPLLLLDELRGLGECKVYAQLDAIPPLKDLDPEKCYTSWDIILTTKQGINAVRDIFIFVEDDCGPTIEAIDPEPHREPDEGYKRLGEILVERGDIRKEELSEVLTGKKYLGEMLVEKGITTPDKVGSALVEQEHIRTMREKAHAKEESTASIRVPAEKLDTLVNLVGQLVTVQARLNQTAARAQSSELTSIAEEVESLTAELRDNTLNIRMLPIGTTFGRFKRLVRDLSNELGKEIDLVTEGAETELDKTVIDRLNDPLVHIIRNAIDHGIELPSIREAQGKPAKGTIHLSASYSGASVLITVKDDGAGLDTEAIRQRAVSKGLIAPSAEPTKKELFAMTFAPGFSTAKTVTNVSGRGVGMDVVRKTIDTLRGAVEVESEQGSGTSVTLKLPLTLAIIDGLLVKVGSSFFVLPLSTVEECIELIHKADEKKNGNCLVSVRGQLVPYIRLRETFAVKGDLPSIEQIIITGADSGRIGFVVDNVIGEHQTVIKTLGKVYRNAEGISGATILGDGRVALILDTNRLGCVAS